ncbi:hypothetical protein SAY86_022931 [Trapa natans]|uniref:RING-type E3 ubiquitin transferase n=1 Tax=Trapa natans TaxID=22666 RepID=A0AAN7R9Q3_TRANT|nr:hypothetical protein SAY86_022931 [Trapa natans]
MILRVINLDTWILPGEEEEEDQQDDDLIMFSINCKSFTATPAMDKPSEETSLDNIYFKEIGQFYTGRTATKHFNRSQVMSSSTEIQSALTSLAITIFLEVCDEEMAALTSLGTTIFLEVCIEQITDQIAELARLVGTRLSNLCEQATAIPRHVEVMVVLESVLEPEEGSHPSLIEFFEELVENTKEIDGAKVYERKTATPSSVIPTDDFEDEDSCVICAEEYSSALEDLVQDIVMLPCSHKYHSKCILEWLRVKYACPLCRSRVPHDHEVIVFLPRQINDLCDN